MSLAKNTYIYLFSNILNAAIPFILLPILTRVLPPEDYGQIAIFHSLLIGLSAFIGVNTVGAANRKYYDEGILATDLSKFNGACFLILAVSMLISILIVFPFDIYLANFLAIPVDWLYFALFLSFFTFIINFRLGQWQIRHKPKYFGTLQVTNSLINMVLTIIFVVYYDIGAIGRIDALLYAGLLTAIFSIFSLYKTKLIQLNNIKISDVTDALAFGGPLVPHIFGAFLLTASDRFVINDRLGIGEAGIYMVAVQFSMALNIVFNAINKAYVPWLYEKLKRNNRSDLISIVKNTYVYFIVLIALSLLSFLVGPWFMLLVVGDEYVEAAEIIGLLCTAQILGGMYLMVTNYTFYAKKTSSLSIVTISCGLFNIILMLLLIDEFGLVGVAMSFLLSKLVQFIATWWLASRVHSMPWLLK